ncbi:MAG: G5 domain-containing protein [Chloroflexi bacterium]|nr:G5 domain-containing protein [Chloroflexota bacterium]MBI3169967.1 G5 domain-containing protein [Chloroflexota bacterium]
MKLSRLLAAAFIVLLFGCQSFSPRSVTIFDGENTLTVSTNETVPLSILSEAGITTQPTDRVLVNGIPYALDESISLDGNWQLQLRRAVQVTLVTPQGEQAIQTSALAVGDFLKENGISTGIHDEVHPPLTTPVTDSLTITFSPAQDLTITSGGAVINIRSAAKTVGEALAEAGIPLMGLDASAPAENEPLPVDGQIKVIHVTESISVDLQSIPFSTEETESADIAFGQQEVLQAGESGVTMVRTRIRYEDGVEVSRSEEEKTILKEPVTQIVANGSKIELSQVGGDAPYQYWYATQMYASWYSPCNSGTGGCSYGTASGARAGYGIVAVDYSYYSYLAGMRVYIPGYGIATIGDTGGGPIIETAFGVPRYQWIDLGYDDSNIGGLSGWVTVYFLEPAPAEIPYFFK